MDIFNLPQELFNGEPQNSQDIIFHRYKANGQSFRGKCVLHRNAISLVLSGAKTMYFADKTVAVNSDEIHFLSAGNCMVTMELDISQPVESILIFFDNKVLADFHLRYKTRIADILKKGHAGVESFLAFKKDGFINNYLASLQLLLQTALSLSDEMKQVKFEELMLYLLEKYPLQILAFPIAKNRDLEDLEIRKAVETNMMTGISLEELAFICNLSLSTFKRRFITVYGMAPRKWFLQKRMELAKQLILQGGERPSELYHRLGYETHSSFSQSFKQFFGISPKELKADASGSQVIRSKGRMGIGMD